MTLSEFNDQNLKVKLRAGASVVRLRSLFTYDSKCIILASGSDVKVYNIQSGECIHTLRYHKTRVVSLQECKTNRLQIYSCSEDGIVVRWDHSEGKILEVHNLNMQVACFYGPTDDKSPWFVIKKVENQDLYRLYSFYPNANNMGYHGIKSVFGSALPREKSVAFGFEGRFVAGVYKNGLLLVDLRTGQFKRHLTGECKLVCVSCHPSDFIVATGDDSGRIFIWSDIFGRAPIKSKYHWHTLPVADMAFSTEGSYLYSGGGEATLVKWNLFANEKQFLPRLGAPICGLSVSPDNSYVITAHNDNSLQIINSQRNIVQVIQGLTQGHFQGGKGVNVLPTGLLYDSLTKALVLNGRPGHLQFYNIHEEKQLFNLDISGRNWVSQEREIEIFNTDVQKAAIDDKGCWLATVEYWNDEETSPQIWLKFWEFDMSNQTFVLNTNVILPHNKEVNCMLFQPRTTDNYLPLAVTTSNDNRFKVWILRSDASFADKQSWTCESMGCYRDFPAGDASFSEEGSLLAVAFSNVATLWTVDTTSLKAVLCYEKNRDNIKQLVFGKQSCSHLLVCHDGTSMMVWNVLSLSIEWIVHSEICTLVADMTSDIVAAFCDDRTLTFFRPNNPEPIHCVENVSDKQIIAAIFVPTKKESSSFLKKSQLFFFDEEQNLLTLTDESDELERDYFNRVKVSQKLPATPFAMLQAETCVSNVKAVEQQLLVDGSMNEKEIPDISYPTLMDPFLICSKILQSLLIPAQNLEDKCSM